MGKTTANSCAFLRKHRIKKAPGFPEARIEIFINIKEKNIEKLSMLL